MGIRVPALGRALRTLSLVALTAAAVGCGDDPAPGLADARPISGRDGGFPDLGLGPADSGAQPLDSGVGPVDSGVGPTDTGAGPADTGVGPADTGVGPGDTGVGPADTGVGPADTGVGPTDTGVAPDSGVPPPVPDADGDGISDADEGNGTVDTDGDGTPDSLDADSDGDGIPDSVEGGNLSPRLPPIDTDGDGTPDFRDLDSDGDGILDAREGTVDPDGDGVPAFRDLDSDGDGILDAVEGEIDPDMDRIPSFLDTDADGDGIPDLTETDADADGDGTPNFHDVDSDGDGIGDALERLVDPDGDGIPAYLDLDSDGDALPDAEEGTADPDGDMTGNWLDLDSDGDTILDSVELRQDPDGDGIPAWLDLDSDGDGLTDAEEAGDANPVTPPRDSDFDRTPDYLDVDSDNDLIADVHEGRADTDGDGIPDRLDIDSDNDSILDNVEAGDTSTATPPLDTDMDGRPDFRDLDSDGDTIVDIAEGVSDADGDGIPNFRDVDSDGDTWLDALEAGDTSTLTPAVDTDMDNRPDYLDLDSDGDGLADANEPGCPAGSDRLRADSDGDGYADIAELAYGSNPCDGASGVDGFYFVLPPGGPGAMAPLAFSNTQIDRADLAINVDTTGSMGGEIANLRTSLSNTIIPAVTAAIPDIGVAVSSFEDFPISPYGDTADRPFRLGTRVTTNRTAAQAAVNALTTRNGLDTPESGLDALYHIAAGTAVTWPGGSVPAFDPSAGRIPGVADGTIGGVGFRTDALPIVVQVTDAPAHERSDYTRGNAGIGAVESTVAEAALAQIGARVLSISNTRMTQLAADPFTPICDGTEDRVFGRLEYPIASDTDWFRLDGAAAGQTVAIETFAARLGSGVDTLVGIYNSTGRLAFNDDITGTLDSRATVALTGAGPYYVAVSSWGDDDHNASGARTAGWWFAEITVNGQRFVPSPAACRADDGNARASATRLIAASAAVPAANVPACVASCEAQLPALTMPRGMAVRTRAVIPTCSWDAFGGGRPAGCGANQCCTGLAGAGVAPSTANGQCPLAFQIPDDGSGLGAAVVQAIQALVNFSPFTITTVVRPDPAELASSGIDTTCFIHGVIPNSATPPNACVPQPVAVDLVPPTPELDSFENVVPGTQLVFDVNALNVDRSTMMPCAPSGPAPRLFRAFIDVVADGVTVVDTRDVLIVVPPLPPTGSN